MPKKEAKVSYCEIDLVINIDLFDDEDIWNYRKYFIVDEASKIDIKCTLYYFSEDNSSIGYVCSRQPELIEVVNILTRSIKNRLIFS